jgi:hypothetical protein
MIGEKFLTTSIESTNRRFRQRSALLADSKPIARPAGSHNLLKSPEPKGSLLARAPIPVQSRQDNYREMAVGCG